MKKPRLILASTSPRRHLLLQQAGFDFVFIKPESDEEMPKSGNFGEVIINNAFLKAQSAAHKITNEQISIETMTRDELISLPILAGDTIVEIHGKALGKPRDKEDAFRMLRKLSGNTHTVHSSIVLFDMLNNRVYSEHVTTNVKFTQMSDDEIRDYIDSGEPLDKAGAYGIQERGALFVESVEGCYFNVMGLSLSRMYALLKKLKDGQTSD